MTWDQLTTGEITTEIPERTDFKERIKNNRLACALSFLVNTWSTALIYKKRATRKTENVLLEQV